MKRVLLATLILFLAGASPALGARHSYIPHHGKACRQGYVRRHRQVKRHGHRRRLRVCVKRQKRATKAPAPGATAPLAKLHAHLDPTFTRDPMDPFKVTYAYSASASQAPAQASLLAGTAVAEEPAPLPSGVLSLYSDGKLECAINVGAGVEGSECPVSYQALGEHRVTTTYSSGEESATETEVENIAPIATATSLSLVFDPEEPAATGWHLAGTLTIIASSAPANPANAPVVTVALPKPPTGTYWQHSGPTGEAFEVEWWVNCEEGLGYFRESHPGAGSATYQKMPLEAFEVPVEASRSTGGGYLGSTSSATLPQPC